jgi:hypothetical protein
MTIRTARLLWLSLGLTPIAEALTAGADRPAIAGGAIYVLGGLALYRATSHDPHAEILRSFAGTRLALASAIGAILALQLVAGLVSGRSVLVAVMGLGLGLFVLWALSRTGRELTEKVGGLVLLTASLALVGVLGEVFFRLPPVVARTGGLTPGMRQWAERNYDKIWADTPHDLRSFHIGKPKQPGVIRLLTVGDSFTWGAYIARTRDIWPYVLEDLLGRKGYSVEVINLAQSGYTTVNEAEALERIGWDLKPDCVIVQSHINDPLRSGPDYQHESPSWLFPTYPLSPVGHNALDRNSYFYSYINDLFVRSQIRLWYSKGYDRLFDDDFAGWRDCRAALRRIGEQASAHGTPILLVDFPLFSGGSLDEASYPYLQLQAKILSAAREAGLATLDLRPVFARVDRDGRHWWALPCDSHPNVKAHHLAARAVAERIEAMRMLDR